MWLFGISYGILMLRQAGGLAGSAGGASPPHADKHGIIAKADSQGKREMRMLFDKALVREKLLAWEEMLKGYALPGWDEFPTLPLYMDQVIYLLNQYLAMMPAEEGTDRQVTPAMINNYVKLKIVPAPVKKRYGRVHLAYLVVVCLLKQTLNTSDIRKLLPADLAEGEVRALYGAFVDIFRQASADYAANVRRVAEPVFRQEETPVAHLVFQVAAVANLSRLLAEQLILLRGDAPEENEGK